MHLMKTQGMKQDNPMLVFILLSLLTGLFVGMEFDFWTTIGIASCAFVFLIYVHRLNNTIPVLELMLFISSIQWLLGAHMSFNYEFQHNKYYMYVDRIEYMGVVVPGFLCFTVGALLVKNELNIGLASNQMQKFVELNPSAPLILVVIGLISPFIASVVPAVIGFVFYLTGSLKFIGGALWLFQPAGARKWFATMGIMVFTLISSIQAGMFHDLLLWLALLFSFVVLQTKMGLYQRMVVIATGFLLAFVIQSVKQEFRARLFEGLMADESPADVFFTLVNDRIDNLENMFADDEYMAEMNVRLNQGWIISAIIDNVPQNEPYANGETIAEAFSASFVPRFLSPEKKIAGGRENFERFTGLPLGENTSMGTSVIGEAYANFGAFGSWVFMFFWGLFLAGIFNLLVRYGKKEPLIYVFLPLIFLQVVKAETELYVVLNHFLKSIVLVFVLLWFFKRYLKWQLD